MEVPFAFREYFFGGPICAWQDSRVQKTIDQASLAVYADALLYSGFNPENLLLDPSEKN